MSICGIVQSLSTPNVFARRATANPEIAGNFESPGATNVRSAMRGVREGGGEESMRVRVLVREAGEEITLES